MSTTVPAVVADNKPKDHTTGVHNFWSPISFAYSTLPISVKSIDLPNI